MFLYAFLLVLVYIVCKQIFVSQAESVPCQIELN